MEHTQGNAMEWNTHKETHTREHDGMEHTQGNAMEWDTGTHATEWDGMEHNGMEPGVM